MAGEAARAGAARPVVNQRDARAVGPARDDLVAQHGARRRAAELAPEVEVRVLDPGASLPLEVLGSTTGGPA